VIDARKASQLAVRRTTTSSVYPMKFDIVVGGETRKQAEGSFTRDGVHITRGPARVANVSREPNTVVAEIFHVWTAPEEDHALMLTVAMAIVESDPSRGDR
jgi:uncharacterized protein YxjI